MSTAVVLHIPQQQLPGFLNGLFMLLDTECLFVGCYLWPGYNIAPLSTAYSASGALAESVAFSKALLKPNVAWLNLELLYSLVTTGSVAFTLLGKTNIIIVFIDILK